MNAPARILIIDPHELMRAGIRLACQSHESLEIVGEADTIEAGRVLLAEHSPDVLILDLATCETDELSLVTWLRAEFPSTRILAFTAVDSAQSAASVIDAGASGYLIKIAGLDEIAIAIKGVHQGRTTITYSEPSSIDTTDGPLARQRSHGHPSVASIAAKLASGLPPDGRSADGRACPPIQPSDVKSTAPSPTMIPPNKCHAGLSEREAEVLDLLAEGMTNKQVAERLFLSIKTVETYRSRIMKKNGLRDRSELVRFAREHTVGSASPTDS